MQKSSNKTDILALAKGAWGLQRWNLKVQQAKTSGAVAALVAYNVISLLHQAKNERLNNSNNDFIIIEAGGNTKQ